MKKESEDPIFKLFIAFLKAHDCYYNFIINRTNCSETLYDMEPDYYIDGSFSWQDSKERHKYWSLLNDEWFKVLHKKK